MDQKQNTSHAVMAQRHEDKSSLDFFPTPGWATRALMEKVLSMRSEEGYESSLSCMEPACGAGHMSTVLKEYFEEVVSGDIHDYGYEGTRVGDFLQTTQDCDWVITNPPFNLAEQFVQHGLKIARRGVAVLVRTSFLETVGRYERIYQWNPPRIVAQFSERVPMVKGRVDKKASTATSYAWLVWYRYSPDRDTQFVWIPPCRKKLEKDSDYF